MTYHQIEFVINTLFRQFLIKLTAVLLVLGLVPLPFRTTQAHQKPEAAKGLIAPARPVFSLLKAVKDGDQERLKEVFSEGVRKMFDEEGWDKVLQTYREVFGKEFGDYGLEDFAFQYTGGEREGKVVVEHKGKKLPGLRVIKEPTGWKVNER
jgi:hypothetical protein